jgi:heat-inducible transcriptional repressor
MTLSQRKKKILWALVEEYIFTAQPVSSQDIQLKYLTDCSSATIRNELSALESMGYLNQPHVSAGRVPTEKAFRLYVDELMEKEPLTPTESALIEKKVFDTFSGEINNVEDIVANVAKVLSEITNYTSLAVKGDVETERIKNITALPISDGKALVVIVTDLNVLKDNIIDAPDLPVNCYEAANKWLNKIFVGKSFKELAIKSGPMELVAKEIVGLRELYKKIMELVVKVASSRDADVVTAGATKIFDYPEYSGDIDKTKNFLTALEQKSEIAQIFKDGQGLDFSVKIGAESEQLPDGCSFVSAKISLNDKTVGSAGVIGPVRMDYKKVISVLDQINKLVEKIITGGKKEDE